MRSAPSGGAYTICESGLVIRVPGTARTPMSRPCNSVRIRTAVAVVSGLFLIHATPAKSVPIAQCLLGGTVAATDVDVLEQLVGCRHNILDL